MSTVRLYPWLNAKSIFQLTTGKKVILSSFERYPDWLRDAYFEIIGVIGDSKNRGLQDVPMPEVYFPSTITGVGSRGTMVRTAKNSQYMLNSIRRDPDITLAESGYPLRIF